MFLSKMHSRCTSLVVCVNSVWKAKNCITITLVNFECYHDVTKVERCLSGTSQAKMSVIVTEHLIPHYFSLSFRVTQLF